MKAVSIKRSAGRGFGMVRSEQGGKRSPAEDTQCAENFKWK